ncbi:MAG: alpha-N-arabinofuranosidase [Sphingomonas sp.]|uniref:alpha-N-arabinofuranosidase n=1 Tax=Sphingomonas sp. TaxID=28214 RepID=UPI0022727672|nr:alpha-L-arabinofuranosidase C-terminal domain-containing protein [Sphingomonas sp.]MCX8477471.1 alpha-N-arabinofuranosidase [Sphingomonas sp.]
MGFGLAPANAQAPANRAELTVEAGRPGATIDPNIYGHFVEHLGRGVYEGIWVGPDSPIPNVRGIRKDVVAALRKIKVPVIRWPGGCFADAYHWQDGIGPTASRPAGINSAWNKTPETNAFGTHEFMDFLGQIGAKPFISVNVGSGSVREADDWMRYMTAPATSAPGKARAANGRAEPWNVPFVGVGNETWGCGGNMTADTYAAAFRHYAAFLRNYSGGPANLIAVGSDTDDYEWTERMMALAMKWRPNPTPLALTSDRPLMWGLSLHFYTFAGDNWHKKGRNVDFPEKDWVAALARANFTDELIRRHAAIMDKYDPEKKVALAVDEWGAWFDSEKDAPSQLYLESTLRDAVIAGMSLNIFNRHADRVRMANIAQMVNVIQSLILTDGAKMVVTPTWHVFDMYKVHQGATLIPVDVQAPDYVHGETRLPSLSVSASKDAGGKLHLTIVNLDPARASSLRIQLNGGTFRQARGEVLTADRIDTRVRFDAPDPFTPAPLATSIADNGITVTIPSKSVSLIEAF